MSKFNPDEFYYLATPYSKYPLGLNAAYIDACKQVAILIKVGIPIFCPIVHTHNIAIYGEIDPINLDIWLVVDYPFIQLAKGLIICTLPTWEQSEGIASERQHFIQANKPIIYMQPNVVPVELLG